MAKQRPAIRDRKRLGMHLLNALADLAPGSSLRALRRAFSDVHSVLLAADAAVARAATGSQKALDSVMKAEGEAVECVVRIRERVGSLKPEAAATVDGTVGFLFGTREELVAGLERMEEGLRQRLSEEAEEERDRLGTVLQWLKRAEESLGPLEEKEAEARLARHRAAVQWDRAYERIRMLARLGGTDEAEIARLFADLQPGWVSEKGLAVGRREQAGQGLE